MPTCARCEALILPGEHVRITRSDSGERAYTHREDCSVGEQEDAAQMGGTNDDDPGQAPHSPVECRSPGRCFVCEPLTGSPRGSSGDRPVIPNESETPPPLPPKPVPPAGLDDRCAHEMLPGQCSYCKPPPRGLPQQVWTSEGGQTFHASPSCPALQDGQNYAERLGMQVHAIVRQSVYEVISSRGQCTACFTPEDLAHYTQWKGRQR